MKIVYHKLIRDEIPEIISKSGKKASYKALNQEEYLEALYEKLGEEFKEFSLEHDLMELCDLEEVLLAIVEARGLSLQEFEAKRLEKQKKNGAFKKKLMLLEVTEDEKKA